MMKATPGAATTALDPAVSAVVRGLLSEALAALARDPSRAGQSIRRAVDLLGERPDVRVRVEAGGLAPWQCRTVEAYISANLDARVSRDQLAGLVRLSGGHFARAFKASFGCSPHAYLVARRVARAQDLLLATRLPLCEIALICGMADQAHFSSVFRRTVGASPSAWRRQQGGPPSSPPRRIGAANAD